MMPPAGIFLAKRSRGLCGVGAVVLAGCAPQVRPTAAELAGLVAEGDGRYEAVAGVLAGRGFVPMSQPYGGPQPQAPSGQCLEKARGNALYGFDVVRVCHDGQNGVEGVYAMQTHGIDWREVRSAP